MPYLRDYLQGHLSGAMPRLDSMPYHGHIPTGDKLKGYVAKLLAGSNAADHVIALADVYTGSTPPEFRDAADAKAQMRRWVGNEPRFYPHAAKFDFEAWLLPYWGTIQRLAGHNMRAAAGNPETVNHNNPPAHRIKSIFEAALQGQLCQTARCRSHFEGE